MFSKHLLFSRFSRFLRGSSTLEQCVRSQSNSYVISEKLEKFKNTETVKDSHHEKFKAEEKDKVEVDNEKDDETTSAVPNTSSNEEKVSTQKTVKSTSRKKLNVLFSEEEQDKFVSLFNDAQAEQLALIKKCGSSKAKKIINFREENGDFSELSDVLKVLGMGEKTLIDICQTFQEQIAGGPVIKDNSELDDAEGQTRKRTTSHIHPRLSPELRENLQSVVTLDVSFEHVTVAKINRYLEVEEWRQIDLFDTYVQKLDHVLLYERIQAALDEIPEGDIYLKEDKLYRYKTLKVVPILTNLRILEYVIVNGLNAKNGRNVVHLMKPKTMDKIFQLQVGNERICAKPFVLDMYRRKLTGKNKSLNDVTISREHMDEYLAKKDIDKDKLNKSLLLGLAFYKLIMGQHIYTL
ncbi:transcription elongation factor, mitochondrial [Mytilus galloprovincialis]|uniref:Transcription elongation factor, mitochondrial n=1 Tax=Mytilus galloprovincialis TaxID=29158 RepID=A0A8B6H2M5_MYTGA|nr:transcription elongation factor, mitochondrial [Mytilus galloprovincialis]